MSQRKLFLLLSCAWMLGFSGALPSAAEAPQLYRLEKSNRTPQALRTARIGADLQLQSPWYEGGITQASCGAAAFDVYETATPCAADPTDGAALGGFDPPCSDDDGDLISDNPSFRWYRGETYCLPQFVNDMTTTPEAAGERYSYHAYSWFWYVTGAGSMEDCYVIVFTAETFNATGVGFPASGYYDGYIVEWVNTDSNGDAVNDMLASGSGVGYYSRVVYFDDPPPGWLQLPMDGQGAYHIIMARDYNGTLITLATCAQPMLWGHKDGMAGDQGPLQWDDDRTPTTWPVTDPNDMALGPDGTFTDIAELYDYTFGLCPDPLCGTTAFWLGDPCAGFVCADMNCDGVINAADIPYFVLALTNLAGWQNLVGPDCDLLCVGDINGDNLFNAGDIPYFVTTIIDPNHICYRDLP